MKSKLRFLFRGVLMVSAFLLVIGISILAPIDRTPLQDQLFYKSMQDTLAAFEPNVFPASGRVKVGWSRFNITPSSPSPMAGFTPRSHFDSVHDSLYARIVAIDNGNATCYLVSMDLLLFPPELRRAVEHKSTQLDGRNSFIYYSVSHTHNGIGGWDASVIGKLILGGYDQAWIDRTSDSIINHMNKAKESQINSTMAYWEADVKECVSNRLAPRLGSFDSKVRGLQFARQDSTRGIVFTYSAHAANISKKSRALSGDYPSATLNKLKDQGFDFGMYMAGMVGSHRLDMDHLKVKDFVAVEKGSDILSQRIIDAKAKKALDSIAISFGRIPVLMGPSQMRVLEDWKVRDWFFRQVVGKLEAEITWLKLGNVLLLGTSCDFSGEIAVNYQLDDLARRQGDELIITSFNGSYTGYITYDQHYEERKKEETRTLNWVGPYFGAYYAEIMKKLIVK